MESIGTTPKTVMLYGPEMHKLHLEFEVNPRQVTITMSATLVAADAIDGYINGVALTQTVYATNHADLMAAVAAKIAAKDGIESAIVTSANVITVTTENNELVTVNASVTNGGAGTAVAVVANSTFPIKAGQLVELTGSGEIIKRFVPADEFRSAIGVAVKDADFGQLVTVAVKGYAVVNAQAGQASMVPGPAKITSYATDGTPKWSVAATTVLTTGWCLDNATSDGDDVRILLAQ